MDNDEENAHHRSEPRTTLCASLRNRHACPHVPRGIKRATVYKKIQEKYPGPDWGQNADEDFVRACAIDVTRDSRRATLYGQIGSRTRTNILCEPAQSKCMSTCHKRHQKSHFIQKLSGKMPLPRMCLERNHTFCASLRSQNACQNFTRATLYWNLQEKCLGPNWAPWSSTGLDTYRKNPSVCGHAVWGTIANHVQNFARNKFH